MQLKKFLLFGLIAAVLPAVAEEAADRKTATSLKYVEHELDTRQNKFGADNNKAMEYTDSAGDVQKRTVKSDLGTSTTDTSLPMVGGVNTKLATKQDDIAPINDHTAVTYTGTSGKIGAKGIYQTSESYVEQSNNLIDAKTFNAALKRGLDSEFLCSEYKPGTDLCWVWSIHNTGDNNLFTTDGATLNKYYSESGTEGNGTYPQYGYNFAHTNFIEVQPNTTYTLSVTCGGFGAGTNHRVIAWDANRGFIAQIANNICSAGTTQRKSATFTTTATTKYLTINYVYDPAVENPRLELGSSETEVPYTTLVPAGFTPVEYIQSSGTQYIDTGIVTNENLSFEIKFDPTVVNAAYQTLLACRIDAQSNSISQAYTNSGTYADFGNNSELYLLNSATTPIVGVWNLLKQDKTQVSMNGHIQPYKDGYNTNFTAFGNLYLFARNNINSEGVPRNVGNYASAKMAYCRIWNNGVLVRDFVPAIQNSDNKVGMYDTVSGTFFTNAATSGSDFTAGNPINNIVYIPQEQQ